MTSGDVIEALDECVRAMKEAKMAGGFSKEYLRAMERAEALLEEWDETCK